MEEPTLSGVVWRKSSHSGSSGGECVEVALLDGVWTLCGTPRTLTVTSFPWSGTCGRRRCRRSSGVSTTS